MEIAYAVAWALLMSPVADGSTADSDKAIPITTAETVVAIYVEDWGLDWNGEPSKLILAVWGDGTTIRSEDAIHGGAPYRTGRLDPAAVDQIIAAIERDGYFDNEAVNRASFGPDSRFTTILVRHGGKQLKMQSWHEAYEVAGKVVATSHGLQLLNGRRKLDVLAADDADYLAFRLAWSELRGKMANALPRKDAPTGGHLLMQPGEVLWQPIPIDN